MGSSKQKERLEGAVIDRQDAAAAALTICVSMATTGLAAPIDTDIFKRFNAVTF
jgi:hypothetical protein